MNRKKATNEGSTNFYIFGANLFFYFPEKKRLKETFL